MLSMDMGHPEEEDVATAGGWQKAIKEVIKAVVVVRTTVCRSFDTDTAGVLMGTGFVVDKQRGIILTSRRLVTPERVIDPSLVMLERLEDRQFVLVKTVDLDGNSQYLTLKQDLRYWPTWEVRFDPETAIWRRTVIKAVDDSDNP
ncbi:hypothetical protein V6N13_127876 [Hibiscus sabdariffa]